MSAPQPPLPAADATFHATHPIEVADLYHIVDRLREYNWEPDGAVAFRTPIATDRRNVDITVSHAPHPKAKPHEQHQVTDNPKGN